MNKLLIIGAGRSATALIRYVMEQAKVMKWKVTVADSDIILAEKKVSNYENGVAVVFDVHDDKLRKKLVKEHDVVVSMLPAFLHAIVAETCIELNTHLLTASYVSKTMAELSSIAEEKGLIFMGEMGLDPGIDHMSAMQHIDDLRERKLKITSFRSYTGGLIAPESDDNPWHYKFTWNPRNVILAGQGTSQYLLDGKLKYIPYPRLFESVEDVEILNHGKYEVYANRDSLLYREAYRLEDIPTLFRGTLRNIGFSESWNAFVQLGLTDDSYPILHSETITYAELIDAFTDANCKGVSVEERVAETLEIDLDSVIMDNLRWTGIFEDKKIGLFQASPAKILEHLLLDKWMLHDEDKDMIIMQHEFEYEEKGEVKRLTTALRIKGKNKEETAMALLVGLPLGILTKLVLTGVIKSTNGVHIPVMKHIYEPVLEELKIYGLEFESEVKTISRS